MKKILTLILAATMLTVMLIGCSSKSASNSNNGTSSVTSTKESTTVKGGMKIGALVVTMQSQWCNQIVNSITAVAKKNGNEVIISDSQVSADNEISGMENLINAGCKVIVVNAMNPAGLADVCKKAQGQGIHIIGFSKLLKNYDTLVVEDPASEATMLSGEITKWAKGKHDDKAEMAEIWLSDASNPDTTAGTFKTAFDAEFKKTLFDGLGIKLVNSQYASDSNAAMNTAEAIITANPNVKVIFCQSDEMAVSVLQALEAKGINTSDMYICGLDGTSEALSNIKKGTALRSSVFVDVKRLGTTIGETAQMLIAKGSAKDIIEKPTLVTSDNVSDYLQ